MFCFLSAKSKTPRKAIYFRCEGRLSKNIKTRSRVKFVTDYEQWEDGTCLIVDSSISEFIFDIIRNLITIKNNPNKTSFYFVIDSMDMMIKRDDMAKDTSDNAGVAGGALITSIFFKRVSVALNKLNHRLILISQLRDSIKINPYEKSNPKLVSASGPNVISHAAGLILEFLPRRQEDLIREGESKTGKIIGHFCRVKIAKGDDENYLREVKYPIRYNSDNGSVWVSKEIVDILLGWELLTRAGSVYSFDQTLWEELTTQGFVLEQSYRGLKNVYDVMEENPDLVNYLSDKFKNLA